MACFFSLYYNYLFKEKTTTKVTKQGTPSLLSSSVNTLARLRRLTSTPALEINTTAHPTFSESYRWHLNTSSPQKTIAIEIKKEGIVSSQIVLSTSILPRVNASAERVVTSSERMKHTSASLMRLNTLELATSVTSSSGFPPPVQASSFVTVEDSSGIRSPIGQIKIQRDVSTSSYVLGTNQTTPVVLGSSLAQAQHVIATRKPENFSSEGISMKPSIASEETASGLQTTPVERPTTQYVPITGSENPLIGKNENRLGLFYCLGYVGDFFSFSGHRTALRCLHVRVLQGGIQPKAPRRVWRLFRVVDSEDI